MSSPFKDWFKENKNSDDLLYAYRQYKSDMEQAGEEPVPFRDWARNEYQED